MTITTETTEMKPLELNHQNHQINRNKTIESMKRWEMGLVILMMARRTWGRVSIAQVSLKYFFTTFKLYFDAFGGTVVSFACFGGASHFVVVVVSF